MPKQDATCPMSYSKLVEQYFMEHRAKLIDIAAFLDRLDRAPGIAPETESNGEDFRIAAFRRAVSILLESHPDRARRVHELFSDRTLEPIASAAGLKGAFGAAPTDSGGSRGGGTGS